MRVESSKSMIHSITINATIVIRKIRVSLLSHIELHASDTRDVSKIQMSMKSPTLEHSSDESWKTKK